MKDNNWQISHGKEADSEFARGRDLQPSFLNLCKAGWQLSGLNRSEGGNAERAPMDWGHLLGCAAACRESFCVLTFRTCLMPQPVGRYTYCQSKARYS